MQITFVYGNFPIKNGNITISNSIGINSNGFIMLESNMAVVDGFFAALRFQRVMADRGTWTLACLGTD